MKKTILFFYSVILSFSAGAQSFQWAKREGDQSTGKKIATDNAGNSYVYGGIFTTTTIGGQSLDPANGRNFIVKYDNAGNSLWVKQLDSMEIFGLECTATDVYVAGRYGTGAAFGGTAVAGGSGWDGYVARLNTAGNVAWIQTINNPATYESANSVSVDNMGNLYVTGTYVGAMATIGSSTFTGTYGLESMFLLKMAPGGSITWSQTVTTDDGSASGNLVEVAPSGDIYVMSSAFGDSVYYGSMYYQAGSYEAELLLHYSNSGTALEMAEVNHNSQDNVTAMTVDGSGNVYTLQTNYLMSFTLAKYSATLDTTWITGDGGGGHLSVPDLEVTQSGEVIVIGQVSEDATFGGSLTVHDYGGGNGFLAYYNSAGSFISLKEMPGNIFMGPAALDASDNVYITGALTDSASFDGTDLTSSGVEAMFVAKYGVSTGLASIKEGRLLVYPNPCAGILNCTLEGFSGTASIELYNELGEKVYEKAAGTGNLQIDLSSEKPGIYFLSIGTDESVMRKKIVVN
ncbi:MAG: hypothetical protein JWO44_359 [Bacteroidetes bacterium]|nr:hypothetical protein [Bacteroidota bacterium]